MDILYMHDIWEFMYRGWFRKQYMPKELPKRHQLQKNKRRVVSAKARKFYIFKIE